VSSLLVQTDKGRVQGYTSKGVDKWRGIPYAAPPVGELRFAPPQQAQPWTDTVQATMAGPICPQLYGIFPGEWSGKEDCLYANIYAPANRNLSKPLPVLVWIYGGGSVTQRQPGICVLFFATCIRSERKKKSVRVGLEYSCRWLTVSLYACARLSV